MGKKSHDNRYQNTKNHGKNYDSKNMMHTFRLLDMAIEIAREKQKEMELAFEMSDLPETLMKKGLFKIKD